MSLVLTPISIPLFAMKDEKPTDDVLGAIAEFINTGPHRMFKDDVGVWKIEGFLFSNTINALPLVDFDGNDMVQETRRLQKGEEFVHLNGTIIRFGSLNPTFTFDLNFPDSLDKIGSLFECELTIITFY